MKTMGLPLQAFLQLLLAFIPSTNAAPSWTKHSYPFNQFVGPTGKYWNHRSSTRARRKKNPNVEHIQTFHDSSLRRSARIRRKLDAIIDIIKEGDYSTKAQVSTNAAIIVAQRISGGAASVTVKDTSQVGNLTVVDSKDEPISTILKDDHQEKKEVAHSKKSKAEKSYKKYAKKLKNRNNMNMTRKYTHAAFGLIFASLNHFAPRNRFIPSMIFISTGTLIMELLRYKKNFGWMNDCLHFVLGSSLRKQEMEGKFTGSLYYFVGVTATSISFSKSAATLAIIQLALGDPSASYFGTKTKHVYWSRIENGFLGIGRNKGILGFLGGALFCLPLNYRMLSLAKFGTDAVSPSKRTILSASLALGFFGAFADLVVPSPALTMPEKVCGIPVPRFHVDDNVVVPYFSGFACTKLFEALNWSVELSRFVIM
mmetsp:Transcript_36996/g.44579  ORF Transcript_36996/g.44579 Transcript_36996/m.44579 type:complete len:426 (+) Transcript_36996:103-1380(+)